MISEAELTGIVLESNPEPEHAVDQSQGSNSENDVSVHSHLKKSEPEERKEPLPRLKSASPFGTSSGADRKDVVESVSFLELFKFADGWCKLYMFLGTIGAFLTGAAFPLFSIIFGEILDSLEATGDVASAVERQALKLFIVGLIAFVGAFLQIKLWNTSAIRQIGFIRKEYLESVLRQEMGWFDRESGGYISAQLIGDTVLIQDALGEKVGSTIQQFTTVICGIAIGFIYGWQLALVTLASLPLIAIAGSLFASVTSSLVSKSQEAYAESGSIAEEVLSGIRTVQAFASQNYEAARYHSKLKDAEMFGIKRGKTVGALHGFVYATMFCSYALSFWYGGKLISDKTINSFTGEPYTGGDVLTIFFSILIGSFALGTAAPFISAITTGRGAATNIFKVIAKVPEIQDGEVDVNPNSFEGTVAFKDVYFSYPTRSDVPVHQGLSFKIESGQVVALVGESGCGKSTTAVLLERFYDPQDGVIELDGIDIKRMKLADLRNLIGLVSQQPHLFAGTIEENIRMGDTALSLDQIINAAKLSNAHDFITKLPLGYQTQIGQSCSELLSGGQIQRIAIARAVIRSPKILLLDEATSALDTESEKVVQHALEKVMTKQTTIIIAHRLSTIRNADRILVFERGVVVEDGKHDDLIKNLNGPYYNLIKAQEFSSQVQLHGESKEESDTQIDAHDVQSSKSGLILESEPSLSFSVENTFQKVQNLIDGAELMVAASDQQTESVEAVKTSKTYVQKIWALSRDDWAYLVLGSVAASFNGVVFPLFSVIVSEMVSAFYQPNPAPTIRNYALGFIALAFAEVVVNFLSRWLFAIVGERLTTKIRILTMKSLLRQEIAFYDDEKNAVGVITAKLSNDASMIRGLTVDWSNQIVQAVTTLAVGISIAVYRDWRVSLFLIALAPFIIIAGAGQMAFMQGGQNKADEESSRIVTEAINSVKTVSAFNLQDQFVSKYTTQLNTSSKSDSRNGSIFAFFFGLTQFILFAMFAASFWFASKMIAQGKSNFSDSFQAIYVMVFSFMSIGELSQLSPDVNKAKDAAISIFSLIDRKSAIDPGAEDGQDVDLASSTVTFKNTSFSYPSRKEIPILQDFSVSFTPGKVIALVGPSGSGKSTIFSLVERFYDVDDGAVFISQHDIRSVNLQKLRRQIAIVSQDPMLFDLSIRENIDYAESSRSIDRDDLILECAKQANILDLIQDLPEGLNTKVGRRGGKLSGGQRQRIAIARALMKDPKLLLLDEATSALDNESEKIIQESLATLMKGRTTLIIAHRLSTIRNADEIIVMSEGKHVERGTHSELMELNGLYSSLVHAGESD